MDVIYNDMIDILECMGYSIFESGEEDWAISDYIVDSLQFIEFIVRVEEKLSIALTDDFLDHSLLMSAKGWSNKLWSFIVESEISNVAVTA